MRGKLITCSDSKALTEAEGSLEGEKRQTGDGGVGAGGNAGGRTAFGVRQERHYWPRDKGDGD